jgi:hypothetical protein
VSYCRPEGVDIVRVYVRGFDDEVRAVAANQADRLNLLCKKALPLPLPHSSEADLGCENFAATTAATSTRVTRFEDAEAGPRLSMSPVSYRTTSPARSPEVLKSGPRAACLIGESATAIEQAFGGSYRSNDRCATAAGELRPDRAIGARGRPTGAASVPGSCERRLAVGGRADLDGGQEFLKGSSVLQPCGRVRAGGDQEPGAVDVQDQHLEVLVGV